MEVLALTYSVQNLKKKLKNDGISWALKIPCSHFTLFIFFIFMHEFVNTEKNIRFLCPRLLDSCVLTFFGYAVSIFRYMGCKVNRDNTSGSVRSNYLLATPTIFHCARDPSCQGVARMLARI